jgi:hypothetical protein
MTLAEKIDIFEERAREERERAVRATCPEARQAHLGLAIEHEQAAKRERARLTALTA